MIAIGKHLALTTRAAETVEQPCQQPVRVMLDANVIELPNQAMWMYTKAVEPAKAVIRCLQTRRSR